MEIENIADAYKIHQEKMKAVKTAPQFGYGALNQMIPGLLPGQLTVIAGGTSMGKTTFLANCAYSMAYKQKRRVLFASLESGRSITQPIMFLAGDAKNDRLHIISPDTQINLAQLHKMVSDRIELCEVLIIDHIHYLSDGKASSISASIGELTRKIQMMAVSLHIPIILVAHVRKLATETSVPSLHDLKDSSALYQDPSTVIILHRFKNETEDLIKGDEPFKQKFSNKGVLLVEKNRDFGFTGVLRLEFNPKTLQFALEDQWIEPDIKS